MAIQLIYARAANGVIGKDNAMPWHLPEDMAHFRQLTGGSAVVMGRKTWDSLPPRFRPLPGRRNIVVTRQRDWRPEPASDQVQRAASVEEAIALARRHSPDVWIIGGAQIYAQALPLADELVVTEIDADFDGDAHAPALSAEWREVARDPVVAASGLRLAFVTYRQAAP